ncbi:flagellar hook-basal body complex protein [Hydrogenimonas sp. SS33]|uniref:flagellar hook-basal body complex protein n=1 Tax=Hydrogenimonas leucolamina TaxID=2954236 RepID=UPI00336BBB7E
MMRSLWAGVSGLQSHQIAMDVEGNNIANVNTNGFKYSRANFADLLSQTSKIATAPQGGLGGKNPMQIGLGTSIQNVSHIFSQGSVQNTDKNTDVAIQGDGFFIVSGDGGKTQKFTRAGDFKFDAKGNFVDNNGYVVQGWLRDEDTNQIDSTAPIKDINIPPGLTTPANPTSFIQLKANLNSGNQIVNKAPTYSSAEIAAGKNPDDFGVLFTGNGEAFNLQSYDGTAGGQGVYVSFDNGATTVAFRYTSNPNAVTSPTNTADGSTNYFRTTEDLRRQLEDLAKNQSNSAQVTINEQGKFQVSNSGAGSDLSITVSGISDANTQDNPLFTQAIGSLAGLLPANTTSVKLSQPIDAAVHSSSIDVFDSLGTKHTVRFDFRKTGFTATGGTSWTYAISVPQPGIIAGAIAPNENILEGGTIDFNSDGSLAQYNPPGITYTANNGSAPNQQIDFKFGTINGFDGITSYDSESATAGISQDGFPGGDLVGIRIDQSGTLIGSFSNGRSFGLAQIAMAKFANNEGLMSDGGNIFIQSANSGDPIIGKADSGGRGFINSSSLEMSNVDLSRSLTQLIVVQRGFQANSKTITTSDQMLQTLLQLKQ